MRFVSIKNAQFDIKKNALLGRKSLVRANKSGTRCVWMLEFNPES